MELADEANDGRSRKLYGLAAKYLQIAEQDKELNKGRLGNFLTKRRYRKKLDEIEAKLLATFKPKTAGEIGKSNNFKSENPRSEESGYDPNAKKGVEGIKEVWDLIFNSMGATYSPIIAYSAGIKHTKNYTKEDVETFCKKLDKFYDIKLGSIESIYYSSIPHYIAGLIDNIADESEGKFTIDLSALQDKNVKLPLLNKDVKVEVIKYQTLDDFFGE